MDLFSQHEESLNPEDSKKSFNLPDSDIVMYPHLFSLDERTRLFKNLTERINWQQDQISFYGKKIDLPRLTAWYGDPGFKYSYSGIPMNPNPWNEDLIFIKKKIEDIAQCSFSSVLLNLYRDGKDSVSWHQDNEKELGPNPTIGSVSFGATRPFQLKHIERSDLAKVDIPLTDGSFLLMRGTTQHYWKHQIPKTSKEIGQRINLTFRQIK